MGKIDINNLKVRSYAWTVRLEVPFVSVVNGTSNRKSLIALISGTGTSKTRSQSPFC